MKDRIQLYDTQPSSEEIMMWADFQLYKLGFKHIRPSIHPDRAEQVESFIDILVNDDELNQQLETSLLLVSDSFVKKMAKVLVKAFLAQKTMEFSNKLITAHNKELKHVLGLLKSYIINENFSHYLSNAGVSEARAAELSEGKWDTYVFNNGLLDAVNKVSL